MNNSKTRVVYDDHDRFGLYLWKMPNGQFVGDDQGNFLNVPSEFGDLNKISRLGAAVRSYGVTEGAPQFFPGHRRISDEEHENQTNRLKSGLIPDDHDAGALKEAYREQQVKKRG